MSDSPASGSSSRISVRRKLLFISIILLVVLSASFGLMEVGLRLATPSDLEQRLRKIEMDELQASPGMQPARRKFKTIYADSPVLGYRLAPNFESVWRQPEYTVRVKTNALGMREHEVDTSIPDAAVLRVLTLGDSFVFGFGVEKEQTFQALLEKRLRTEHPGPVEVLNGGIPGYGTCHENILLKELSPSLKPDLVLVCFYVGNDLIDNLYCLESGVTSERVINGAFVSNKRYHIRSDELELQRVRNPLKRFLIQSSYAYNFFDMKLSGLAVQIGLRPKSQTLFKSVVKFHRKQDSEEEIRVYAYTEKLLQQMRDTCKDQDMHLALILFPAKVQIVPGLFAEQLRGFGVNPDEYSIDKPNQRMRHIAEELDIPVLDLYEPFRKLAGERLYYEQDGHWTEAGHRLAAEQIYNFLMPTLPPP